MSSKSVYRAITWTILLITICPQMGSLEESSDNLFEIFVKILKNSFNMAIGTADFIIDDIRASIDDELDDITPHDWDTYDFIVVGAGSAGAVVAARLSEDPGTSVLLIEAGSSENHMADIPLLALYLQLAGPMNWNYKMEHSPNYCRGLQNQQCRLARGKVMGGCSVLNFMIATRGHYEDYDNWADLGCEGWSWRDVYPIFKQLENFEVRSDEIESRHHNKGGPLNIAHPPYRTKIARAYLEAAKERGYPNVDYDGDEMIGYAYTHATVKNGSRFSTNRAYLYPAKGRPNLFVSKHTHADKILIDRGTKRAYGVLMSKDNQKIHAIARREVILSAGAIGSPKLLMLSGVGPAAHLQDMNIRVLKDAPVGKNLMDHMTYWGLNVLVNDSVTIVTNKFFDPTNNDLADYFTTRKGPLTVIGGVESVVFLKVDEMNSQRGWPDMELLMTGTSVGSDMLAHIALAVNSEHNDKFFKPMRDKESFMIMPTLLRPKSRGEILLKSKHPNDHPRIIPNYFSHPDDMRKMILGIREAVNLIRTRAMQKYDAKLPEYSVPGCENFQRESDEYWECAVRTFADTLWHPSGTCKMGARNNPSAVVDPRLRVMGVEGLRVADASVMPMIISGHTNVPTIMIGEKLARMVKEDWRMHEIRNSIELD